MATLTEIEQEYQNLMFEIEQCEELTPELDEKLTITKENLSTKLDGYVSVINKYDSNIAIRKAEIEIYKSKIKDLETANTKDEKSTDWLKYKIKSALELFEMKEVKTPLYRISFRHSKALNIFNSELLPKFCFVTEKVVKQLSKTDIKALIENGKNVPGAEIVENKSLQIK